MNDKANAKLIKTLNEVRLLNMIREESPISRRDLSRRTKISKVAVSDIINRLNKAGFILEIGKGTSTRKGGKKPILLKLNPENRYVLGIEIKRKKATIALANIDYEIKEFDSVEYPAGSSLDDVIAKIFFKIDTMIESSRMIREKLISIGIGIPGFIDYTKGELIFADTLRGWAKMPLASRFADRYNVSTIIENDVNTIALGESLLGAGRGSDNLICIWIGEGIGSGIIVDGQLVRGAMGNAGEIGYIELGNHIANSQRLKNLYSNQRYFGEILSEINLHDALKMKLQWNSGRAKIDVGNYTIEALLRLGDEGDPDIKEVLDEYAFIQAILCMNLIKTLNPSLIILSGSVIESSAYLLDKIRQLIKQSMMNIPFQPGSVVLGELKKEAGVKGAIALALQTIFEPPMTKSKNHVISTK